MVVEQSIDQSEKRIKSAPLDKILSAKTKKMWGITHKQIMFRAPISDLSTVNTQIHILVCDDDPLMRKTLTVLLQKHATVHTCAHTDEGLQLFKNKKIDLVILDVEMRTKDEGVKAIPRFLEVDPEISILMLSGDEDYKTVKESLKAGARDYISKRVVAEELEHTVQRTLHERNLINRVQVFKRETQVEQNKYQLIGKSKALNQITQLIEKYKKSDANVLIFGETGTGKERVAKLLRRFDTKTGWEPFIAIDSSTLHLQTAESLLFGHEKGAFTGANERKKGLFEEAHGGAVFFDEIANMPIDIQKKLLRVLQEKEVKRLGSNIVLPLEFRVIAATNRDLEKMVKEKEFLEDLLERLNVLPLNIPPLREHTDDIEDLVAHYLKAKKRNPLSLSKDALACILQYPWPGNIRELFAVLEYAMTLCESERIEIHDLPPKLLRESKSIANSFYERVEHFEANLLKQEYEKQSGKISKMAEVLKMDRSHLHSKLKQYGIHTPRTKGEED